MARHLGVYPQPGIQGAEESRASVQPPSAHLFSPALRIVVSSRGGREVDVDIRTAIASVGWWLERQPLNATLTGFWLQFDDGLL